MMYNVIGTIGVAIILTTYFLLQTNRIHANELRYSVLNFFGAGMILISLIYDFNFIIVFSLYRLTDYFL